MDGFNIDIKKIIDIDNRKADILKYLKFPTKKTISKEEKIKKKNAVLSPDR